MQKLFETTCHKMVALQAVNSDLEIPELVEMRQELEYQFAHATEVANGLDSRVQDFEGQRDQLENELQREMTFINEVRDRLSKVEDLTGSDEDLAQRLEAAKVSSGLLVGGTWVDACRELGEG